MKKTGRTCTICLKVTPEIKRQIDMQIKEGMNLTATFEELWTQRYPQLLEDLKATHIAEIDRINKLLDNKLLDNIPHQEH